MVALFNCGGDPTKKIDVDVDWKNIAEDLWGLLDDIDTHSDMLKPDKSIYFTKVDIKCRERFKIMHSDGYRLTPVIHKNINT